MYVYVSLSKYRKMATYHIPLDLTIVPISSEQMDPSIEKWYAHYCGNCSPISRIYIGVGSGREYFTELGVGSGMAYFTKAPRFLPPVLIWYRCEHKHPRIAPLALCGYIDICLLLPMLPCLERGITTINQLCASSHMLVSKWPTS